MEGNRQSFRPRLCTRCRLSVYRMAWAETAAGAVNRHHSGSDSIRTAARSHQPTCAYEFSKIACVRQPSACRLSDVCVPGFLSAAPCAVDTMSHDHSRRTLLAYTAAAVVALAGSRLSTVRAQQKRKTEWLTPKINQYQPCSSTLMPLTEATPRRWVRCALILCP